MLLEMTHLQNHSITPLLNCKATSAFGILILLHCLVSLYECIQITVYTKPEVILNSQTHTVHWRQQSCGGSSYRAMYHLICPFVIQFSNKTFQSRIQVFGDGDKISFMRILDSNRLSMNNH